MTLSIGSMILSFDPIDRVLILSFDPIDRVLILSIGSMILSFDPIDRVTDPIDVVKKKGSSLSFDAIDRVKRRGQASYK